MVKHGNILLNMRKAQRPFRYGSRGKHLEVGEYSF